VREALFDILGSRIEDACFLDLFAGTGAVGIEALSRGARRAVFVESDKAAARLIRENLTLLGREGEAEILVLSVAPSLAALALRGERFDVVFLDPPYDPGVSREVLSAAARLVLPGGTLIVEHPTRRPPDPAPQPSFRAGRVYRYGDTSLTVLRRALDEEAG
jgi:16S rRNA (guanine(966)-N(2))-methyltransferase RsmD